jgi:hypothetical protein
MQSARNSAIATVGRKGNPMPFLKTTSISKKWHALKAEFSKLKATRAS